MENAKKQVGLVKKVGAVLVTFTVFIGGLYLMGSVSAKEVYEPQAPQAEKVYQMTLKANCEAELALTSAKLLDSANNALQLTADQVKDLVVKKQTMKCDF